MKFEISLKNKTAVLKALEKLAQPDLNKVAAVTQQIANELKRAIELLIPVGATGNLKKSLVIKPVKGGGDAKPLIVAMDRKIAPHIHWVEKGTGDRWQKSKAYKYVGKMPAVKYFSRGVESAGSGLQKRLYDEIKKIVLEAAK